VTTLDLQEILRDSVLEIRGDGKAGGGLILAFQSLAKLLLQRPEIQLQEWPFFSSARRGAGIRSFLRVSSKPIQAACEVTRPSMTVLMDEAAARSADFAEGVPPGGTYVLNTRHSPEECARHFKLSGRVLTVPGDDLGRQHLKAAIGNASVYVAMATAVGGFARQQIIEGFLTALKARHIPEMILERNRQALEATFEAVRIGTFEECGPDDHRVRAFQGYGNLPVGAQTPLRLSLANRTSDYAPSGLRLRFEDPGDACTGCAHCIVNCPEGVILFEKHPERGVKVTGVEVTTYCKMCRECIAICPEDLFKDLPYEEKWAEEEALR
jgi:2-oxoacid:acceptor oxidoreductase gamma subunit (pyruvate/2-ketoisovalerate family)